MIGSALPLFCLLIAEAFTWRRLAMAALRKSQSGVLAAVPGTVQYAVGVPAALEKLASTLSQLISNHPDHAVLQIDATCAFNSMHRDVMLEVIEASCPEMLTAFAVWLARPTMAVFVHGRGTGL